MKKSIIIADDNAGLVASLKDFLGDKNGYEVVAVAENGAEALAAVEKHDPDFLLLDIVMPELDGFGVLAALKNPRPTVIMMSQLNTDAFVQKALRYGCIDYLLKPVEKQDLLSILSKYNNISQNSKMEEQYELAYQARCLISLLFGKYDPNGVDYLHKHLDFSDGVRYIEISACHSSDGEDDDDENHFRMVQRDLYQSCVQILGEDRSRCFYDASLDRVGYGIAFVYSGALARNAGCSETQYIQDFYKKLGVSTQHELRFLVGKKVDDITTVSESYDTVCGLKNLCAFRQQKSIYYYEEELSVPQKRAVLCKDTLDQLITAIELNEQERIGSEIDHLFAEMQQRGVHDKDINLNLNYLLFRLMHLASNLDNEANQKEMLQFISAQSFREGISRGSRQHLFRFAREYADYLSLLRKNISTDIIEAATIDGCTGLKKVLKIQLPLLMPTITINLFVSIAGAFKSFDIPYAMTGGGPGGATNTIALNIYNDAFSTYEMGYACAKSVVLFLIVMAITCIQLYLTRRREVQL